MDWTKPLVLATLGIVALAVLGSIVVLGTVTIVGPPALVTTGLVVLVVVGLALRGTRPHRRLETPYW